MYFIINVKDVNNVINVNVNNVFYKLHKSKKQCN